MKLWLRSLAFNAAFNGVTMIMCVILLWALPLPRRAFLGVVHLWLWQIGWVERVIGGIRTCVKGREHIPPGACIIAAKHQSAWETFKLHVLFGDPAIVLKKELLSIPVWGWYLRRSGVIAIDRARGGAAVAGMMRSAHKAAADGRKIVIFPQGTRIPPLERRPYKSGIARLYQELNLPVVPMALNAGLLWPKNSFIKKPGTITIAFLPPIPPGLPRAEFLQRLETELEAATDKLCTKQA